MIYELRVLYIFDINILIYELDALYIFDINIIFLIRYAYLFDECQHKYSPWDWDQIGIKLGTEHAIYQMLANFMYKKYIHVNRLESVIFGM